MKEKMLVEKKLELEEGRTKLLLSQIQPHFIFNSLTVCDQLCKKDPEQAHIALQNFSSFLRYNLSSLQQSELVPFENELKYIKSYLTLEQMRFKDYLKVEYDITTTQFLVPALAIQQLGENAVKHGLHEKKVVWFGY